MKKKYKLFEDLDNDLDQEEYDLLRSLLDEYHPRKDQPFEVNNVTQVLFLFVKMLRGYDRSNLCFNGVSTKRDIVEADGHVVNMRKYNIQ